MNRLEKTLSKIRKSRGEAPASSDDSLSLEKSIRKARERLLGKNIDSDDDIQKGVHDAMYHHACHAKAADSACYKSGGDDNHRKKCKSAAKQHGQMFLKHAVANASKKSDLWGMKNSLRKNLDHFDDEASDSVYSVEGDPDHAKRKKHHESGGGFVPHAHDKNLG